MECSSTRDSRLLNAAPFASLFYILCVLVSTISTTKDLLLGPFNRSMDCASLAIQYEPYTRSRLNLRSTSASAPPSIFTSLYLPTLGRVQAFPRRLRAQSRLERSCKILRKVSLTISSTSSSVAAVSHRFCLFNGLRGLQLKSFL